MKSEFGAVEAAGSDRVSLKEKDSFAGRKRTAAGFVLPPGFIAWDDYVIDHPDASLEDLSIVARKRWEPGYDDVYLVSDDSEARQKQEQLLREFRKETRLLICALEAYFSAHHLKILLNPRNSKKLSERQRHLPKLKILLLPLLLRSDLQEEKEKDRDQGIRGIADCLLHFSEDGAFQLMRYHGGNERRSDILSVALSYGTSAKRKEISDAYRAKDFHRLAEILGDMIVGIFEEIARDKS